MNNTNDEGEHVSINENLLGEVSDTLASTDATNEVLDILPSTEILDILPAKEEDVSEGK